MRSLSGFVWASEPDLSVNELFFACGFAPAKVRLKERRQCGSASGEDAVPERDTQQRNSQSLSNLFHSVEILYDFFRFGF